MHEILVVIVTYNPCIQEFRHLISALAGCECDVAVIDNNSENRNAIKKALLPQIKFDGLSSNVGLPAAQNFAVDKFRFAYHRYLLFLDQDTVINSGFVEMLFKSFLEIKKVDRTLAAIGPKLIDKRSGYVYKAPKVPCSKINHDDRNTMSEYLISSGMFIEADVYKKVGMNNPNFFIDYVDIDLSFRLRHAGHTLYTVDSVGMEHTAAEKTYKIFSKHIPLHNPWRKYYQVRNLIFVIFSGYAPIKWIYREVISSIFNNMVYLLISKEKISTFKYLKSGLYDGLSTVFMKK